MAFSIVIVISVIGLVTRLQLFTPTQQLNTIRSLDDGHFESITLALGPFTGTMLAANFLQAVDLYSWEASYYPKVQYDPTRIDDENPLLTHAGSDYLDAARDYTELGQGVVLVTAMNNTGLVEITSVTGAHGLETDGTHWWRWIEHKVNFALQAKGVPEICKTTQVELEYATRGNDSLKLELLALDGSTHELELPGTGGALKGVKYLFETPPHNVIELQIQSDGLATPLSKSDTRKASWLIRNLRISPLPDCRGSSTAIRRNS
jgi:hypothetical protein